MKHRSRYLLAGACAPLLASCVFLLDYDELQGGATMAQAGTGGAAGTAGTSGVAGAAGEAGAGGAACGECDDQDPCTIDTCDATGEAPECLHEPSLGLKLDGVDQVLEAEQHVRVSLAAGSDIFYLAELHADEDVPDVNLYSLTNDRTELTQLGESITSALPIKGTLISNVGLTVDRTLGGLAVHGFVAVKPAIGDRAPKVFHIVNRGGENMANLVVGASYWAENPFVFPQALTIGTSKVVGAWIQADGTIALHDVGRDGTDVVGSPDLPATTLALLATAGDDPAVAFSSWTEADGSLGTYVASAVQAPLAITECQTAQGGYLSTSAISTQIPGLWLGNVTKGGDDYLTTGGFTLACGVDGMCTPLTDACKPEDLSNSVRNIAGDTAHFETDPAGVIHTVLALPQLALKEGSDSELEAKLSVVLARADFSDEGAGKSETIGGDPVTGLMELSRQDTGDAFEFTGPDWPAVAILPSKQVALAWIQPNAQHSGTELHVQRYKICLPPE